MRRRRGLSRVAKLMAPLVILVGGLAVANSSVSAGAAMTAPAISGLSASPSSLPSGGGTTTVKATVKDATHCSLTSKPVVKGLPESVSCSKGSVSARITLPADSSTKADSYVLTLSATGSGTKTATVTVTVSAPAPTITGLVVSPSVVASGGGTTTLTAHVTHATSCTLAAKPTITGLTKTVSCTKGTVSVPITLPANRTSKAISYQFTLTAKSTSTTTAATTATVSAPTAPTISDFIDTPVSIGPSGGTVTVSAKVTVAKSCTLESTPALSGLPMTVSCASGSISVPVTIPANTSTSLQGYSFSLSATGIAATTTATPISLVQGGAASSLRPTDVSGTLTQNTTWSPADASAYIVSSSLTVPAGITLTIDPGVVVKSSGSLYVDGTLNAVGTPTRPIVFTSVNDNSVGGTTGSGSPVAGDWSGIQVSGAGSIESTDTDVEYAALAINGTTTGNLAVSNDSFVDVSGGVQVYSSGTMSVSGSSLTGVESGGAVQLISTSTPTTSPTLQNNSVVFAHSAIPQVAAYEVSSSALNPALLTGNSSTGPGFNGIQLAGTLSSSGSLVSQTIPWAIGDFYRGTSEYYCQNLTVPAGLVLTLASGAVVKGDDHNDCGSYGTSVLRVQGTLNAVGTPTRPIVFTSVNDNSVGGTTGSGSPVAGDWSGIQVSGAGSIESTDTDVEYAALAINGTTTGNLAVSNDSFVDVSGGVQVYSSGTMSVSGSSLTGVESGGAVQLISTSTPTTSPTLQIILLSSPTRLYRKWPPTK